MEQKRWGDKPYYSLDYYYKQTFGQKVYKLSLNGGFTCPNRDGTLGRRGCIFCSAGGSGDFAPSPALSITKQLSAAKILVSKKIRNAEAALYIAYFQAFTNTYAPLATLRRIYEEALQDSQVVGLAIGTRPDCLPDDVVTYLSELNQRKPVYVELGLQTIYEKTADYIRRGYPLSVFEDAVARLSNANIPVVVHIILGLPGETEEMLIQTIQYLNRLPIQGVKLAMLHVLKGTDLAQAYTASLQSGNMFLPQYTLEEYCNLVTTLVGYIRPDIVIHRLTGDGPKSLLISPLWTADKRRVLNTLAATFKRRNIYQGMNQTITPSVNGLCRQDRKEENHAE